MIALYNANYFYGHAKALAEYVGVDDIPRIRGHIQHGWNAFDGYNTGSALGIGSSRLVWSENAARRGYAMGRRHYRVIGSPWIYLLQTKGIQSFTVPDESRKGTIFYPFHGWEFQNVIGDHTELIAEIRDIEGDDPVTACLYWNEFEDPKIRSLYEEAGFRTVCNGHRGDGREDRDNNFLEVQLSELLKHRRVASNRVCTALLYGNSVGCEIGVYGDPMIFEDEHDALGGHERIELLWPELLSPKVDMNFANEFTRDELGYDSLLSPLEMKYMLGWLS